MKLYSLNGSLPEELPNRIRLSDGSTRTDRSTFTDEEIANAGYVKVSSKPTIYSKDKIVYWSVEQRQWLLRDKTLEDIQIEKIEQISKAEQYKNTLLNNVNYRLNKYLQDISSEQETSDNEENLNSYKEAILNIDIQSDPFDINWPMYGSNNTYKITL